MSRPKLAKNPMCFESFEALLGLDNMNDGAYNSSYDGPFSVHELCMDEIQPFPNHPFRKTDVDKQIKKSGKRPSLRKRLEEKKAQVASVPEKPANEKEHVKNNERSMTDG